MSASSENLKRNLLFNTVGNVLYFVCQWLITGLFVKTMSPDGQGIVNAGIIATASTASNMFLTFAQFGMRNFQVSDPGKFSDLTYINSRFLTSSIALVFCYLYSLAIGYRGEQLLAVIVWLLYKLVEAISDVYHGCCQKQGRMDVIGISYGVRGILTVIAFCATLKISGSLMSSLVVITALSYVFSVYYDIIRNRQFIILDERKGDLRAIITLLIECLPLAAYAFLSTASASVPRTVLERLCGTELIGIYNLVNSPVLIIQVGIAYIFAPFIGVFADKLRSGHKKEFLQLAFKLTMLVFALGLCGIVGVLVLGKWGLTFLYGTEMAGYSNLLVPMVVTTIFTCMSLFYSMLLTVLRDMKGLIISNIVGIAVSLIASLLIIGRYTLIGTAYASVIALIIQCLCLALSGYRCLNTKT